MARQGRPKVGDDGRLGKKLTGGPRLSVRESGREEAGLGRGFSWAERWKMGRGGEKNGPDWFGGPAG
jgi:hypothetical protein